MSVDLTSPEGTRSFLALCLHPGPGRPGRTVDELAAVLPAWVMYELREHAPELGALRDELTAAETVAAEKRAAFATALGAWINEAPGPSPKTT